LKNYEVLYLLYLLARRGAHGKSIRLNSNSLAEDLKASPKTASRKLIELEALGYIGRKIDNKGQYVWITSKGLNLLKAFYQELRGLLEGGWEEIELGGKVFKGLGEGAYYVSLEHYRKEFLRKLGFDPFPGTLNLLLDRESVKKRRVLELLPGIEIEGFKDGLREYCSAKAFKAFIANKVKGAVLLIERTHYGPDVLEIISPYNLRKLLNLKDGDYVTVRVLLRND